MNESEINLDIAPDNKVAALQEEIQSLRALVVGALLVLIVFTGALDFFLGRQASLASNQAAEAQSYVEKFNTVDVPSARDFWNRLIEYSKAHPDFNPIIVKYNQFFQTSAPGAPAAAPKK